MDQNDLNIARAFKQRLSTAVELLDCVVFGSRARGDADEDSDLDIFVEIPLLDDQLLETIFAIAWEVGFQYHRLLSPTIFTREEIEHSPLRASPILAKIRAEGVPV